MADKLQDSSSAEDGKSSPSVRSMFNWNKKNKKNVEPPKYPPVAYWKLFRYATSTEMIMIVVSLLAAVGHGTLLPVLTILFGRIIDDFGDVLNPTEDGDLIFSDSLGDDIDDTTNLFLIVSFVAFAISFVQLFFALTAANSMGNSLRRRFFDNLIAQDCDFYDDNEAGALTHIVVNDINLIQGGIGDKLATAVQYLTTFVVGIIIGFAYGWKLTLVVLAVTPLLMIAGAIFGNASAEATGDGLGAYGEAGAISSEVLSLIRTVTAFGGQEDEAKRYESSLEKAYRAAVRAAVATGVGLGTSMLLILSTYGLAFWYGSVLVRNEEMSAGDVLLVFFAITLGASSLGTAGPAFKSFSVARAAAPRVFEIIDRQSPIDPTSEDGIVPTAPVEGHIRFENVDFNYSKRIVEEGQAEFVLNNFNLEIPVGTSEAFCGKSGSGKSTVARLIQRFYDPLNGRITLDGVDLRELNVKWLRSQIGVVAQMPSLFMLSIKDNIALGAGLEFVKDEQGRIVARRKDVSDEQIIRAAKMANAHSFITKLPEGYNTMLGERGAMLSGGQKQRVCIARALVRDPKVLLLDESTASLDTASERIVQDALDKAATGRTTITIAHRLSTIRNADNISCVQNGYVIERGPHDALVSKEGFYRGLIELQRIEKAKMEEEKKVYADDDDSGGVDTRPQAAISANALSVSQTRGESTTKGIDGVVEEEDKGPDVDKGLFTRTLRMNSSEWFLMLIGTAGAVLGGVIWPLASISLVELIEIMLGTNETGDVRFWALSFVILGAMAFAGNILQHAALGVSGEKLTKKLRTLAFRSLLRQEIGYFDMEDNSLGALTTRLSADAGAVKGLTGDLYGVGVNILGSLLAGLLIAFVNCWQLTLVVLAIIPGIALGGYFEMQASAGIDSGAKKDFAKANTLAAEAVDNVGTVRSLGIEDYFVDRYHNGINETVNAKRRKALFTGMAFGFSEFCQYIIWYATFKAGGDFVERRYCTFQEMLLSSMAILFAAITLGNVSIFAPDVAASKIGATQIYRLIDRTSSIDPSSPDGEKRASVNGDIKAEKVYFEYPRRPDVRVLRGLSLDIMQGKTFAIVGTSGHGKSTIISLLERFYAIREGVISVDGHDIAKSNVQNLRSHIGIVSQEPELFNRSVFDNITYGASHEDGTPISMSDVVEAAKLANAHEFIMQLPQGYDTLVGPRGDAISGGQRQRVAIARSLIRRPPILLLDEATSALDSASEGIVQEALDRAASERTTIVVAHRLSTIRNADVIAVVRKGRIIESGTHDVLLRRNGAYAELIQHQLTDV
ncbi:ABC transporter type 1 [Gracilaria domingensis]|nr:ABC transporter type 1 [Gracilaria domingensis]